MTAAAQHAIVTPYYREPRAVLERCLESVRRQEVPTEHILVADGAPQDWLDDAGVRHIRLDRGHADWGNTPRGIGALLAITGNYQGFGFLDADNWLEPSHVGACLRAAAQPSQGEADYVIARRSFRRPDGTLMALSDEPPDQLIDTNCFFFLPGAYAVVPYFGTMPRELSVYCDRIFTAMIRRSGLVAAQCRVQTVNYETSWAVHYRALGETPPEDAKETVDFTPAENWVRGLSRRQRLIAERLSGIPFAGPPLGVPVPGHIGTRRPQPPGRNEPCPCGSGRKYKLCHGKGT